MKRNEETDRTASIIDINRVIHEPARFLILAHLFVVEAMEFLSLMKQTGLSQGNLSSHLSRLEKAGYVKVVKGYAGRRPRTMLNITDSGRKAFTAYRERMQQVLEGPLK
jgi:DNA-binding MarR family transcriptional regulator